MNYQLTHNTFPTKSEFKTIMQNATSLSFKGWTSGNKFKHATNIYIGGLVFFTVNS